MPKQVINIGAAPDDGTGDPLRTSFSKVNDNFTELYDEDAAIISELANKQPLSSILTATTASFTTAHETKLNNLSGVNTGDQTSVSGNAGTATALATGRTLAITGDLSWTSPPFNGTTNVSAAGTLASVNSNVGTFGSSSAIPVLTVDAKGRVTAVTTASNSGGSDPWSWLKLASDVSNSTTTLADVTGLSFTAAANTTYVVKVIGAFQSAATTTGIAAALDIPSGSVIGQITANISAIAINALEQIADDATTGVSTAARAVSTNTPIVGEFVVAVGATGGPVTLRFRSEVASSAVTMKAGLTVLGYRAI